MPIYEYACEACGARFEMLQPLNAPAPDDCTTCGAPRVHRLVSVTSFVLKGSGWYRDHYGLKPASSEPSSAPSVASSPAAGPVETKAAAK